MAINFDRLSRVSPVVYHLTAAVNRSSIVRHGTLFSASHLITPDAGKMLLSRRVGCLDVRFQGGLIRVRDQKPLRQGQMRLEPGYSFQEFLRELNGRVFFWPGKLGGPNSYGLRHAQRYAGTEELLILRCPLRDLVGVNPEKCLYVCRFNSGAPRRNPKTGRSPRGPETFRTLDDADCNPGDVVEISFRESVRLPPTTEFAATLAGPWMRSDVSAPDRATEGDVALPVDDAHADPTLIDWMLDRSPEQRLAALQGFVDSLWELRGGSKT